MSSVGALSFQECLCACSPAEIIFIGLKFWFPSQRPASRSLRASLADNVPALRLYTRPECKYTVPVNSSSLLIHLLIANPRVSCSALWDSQTCSGSPVRVSVVIVRYYLAVDRSLQLPRFKSMNWNWDFLYYVLFYRPTALTGSCVQWVPRSLLLLCWLSGSSAVTAWGHWHRGLWWTLCKSSKCENYLWKTRRGSKLQINTNSTSCRMFW